METIPHMQVREGKNWFMIMQWDLIRSEACFSQTGSHCSNCCSQRPDPKPLPRFTIYEFDCSPYISSLDALKNQDCVHSLHADEE